MKKRVRRKTGPKPRPAAERRTEIIGVRLTEAERDQLTQVAGSLPLGTWFRLRGLEAARTGSVLDQAMQYLKEATTIRDQAEEIARQREAVAVERERRAAEDAAEIRRRIDLLTKK